MDVLRLKHSHNVIKICRLIIVSIVMTSVQASLQGPMIAKREAKARLLAEIRNHSAVKQRIAPAGPDDVVHLQFRYWPFEVLYVDEVEQSLTTVGYVDMYWTDQSLGWNRSDYGGVSSVRLPFEVWLPHIIVTNSAKQEYVTVGPENGVILYFNGRLNMLAPILLKTTCDLDLDYFPFDTQTCEIVFLPFFDDVDFNVSRLNLYNMPDPFRISGEWSILSREIINDFYIDQQPLIRCRMRLKRSSNFYIFNVLLPVFVTSSMTSLVFLIPPDTGEKISYLVTVFVSNAVFLNFVAGTMPRNMTRVPRLTLFLVFVMGESLLSMGATIFVMRRYRKEQEANKAIEKEDAIQQESRDITPKEEETETSDVKQGEIRRNSLVLWKDGAVIQLLHGLLIKARKVLSADNIRKSCKKGRKNKRRFQAAQWDLIFFILYNALNFPIIYLLFAI